MKVVILAGGFGTRLSEETDNRPKPMIEVGGRPLLWHIMKHYAYYGFEEFFIALGYKGELIKRYFLDYDLLVSDVTINLARHRVQFHEAERDNWIVHLVDTGLNTLTGGRVKRLQSWLSDGPFMLTYGDGVSDLDLSGLLQFHYSHGKLATITAVRPPSRFGGIIFDGHIVSEFTEKPQIGEGWINGGFMVLNPDVLGYIKDDSTNLEADTLERLAADHQLVAYRHDGFWQCMDTLRDKRLLENLWEQGNPPWKLWKRP